MGWYYCGCPQTLGDLGPGLPMTHKEEHAYQGCQICQERVIKQKEELKRNLDRWESILKSPRI